MSYPKKIIIVLFTVQFLFIVNNSISQIKSEINLETDLHFIENVGILFDEVILDETEYLVLKTGFIKKFDINIFPNPSIDHFCLETSLKDISNPTLFIYSSSGKKVMSRVIKNNTTEIDTDNLPSGNYLAFLIHENEICSNTIKVTILK